MDTRLLFASQEGRDCMRKKLCQATRMKDFGHNRALYLVKLSFIAECTPDSYVSD